ncbi:hypothetical protein [Rhizobium tibeticum]|uniref:hypothetical protein n=1 Tax=Rhizobium tibeticum TaxID=501024 RepID=UPI003B968BAF
MVAAFGTGEAFEWGRASAPAAPVQYRRPIGSGKSSARLDTSCRCSTALRRVNCTLRRRREPWRNRP